MLIFCSKIVSFVAILLWVLPSALSRKERWMAVLRFVGLYSLKSLLFWSWNQLILHTSLNTITAAWFWLLPAYAEFLLELLCLVGSVWFCNPRPRLFTSCGQAALVYAVQGFTYSFASAYLFPLLPLSAYIPGRILTANMVTRQALYAPLISVLICAVFYLLARWLKLKQHYEHHTKGLHWLFLILTGLMFLYLSLPLWISYYNYDIYLYSIGMMALFLPALLFLVLLFGILFVVAVRHADHERQQREIALRIEDMNAVLDDSKRSAHDFHKHIRHLQSLTAIHTAEGTYTLLKSQVDAYCDELLNHSSQEEMLLHLADPTFRALLYGRRTQARESNIEFVIDATPTLPHFPIKNYQLVEIFENLLDNAFDEVESLTDNRFIRVYLACEPLDENHVRHTLRIDNPYTQLNMEKILSGKRTTKGGAHRGVGLDKVGKLVRATGGTLTIKHENRLFSVTVCYTDAT